MLTVVKPVYYCDFCKRHEEAWGFDYRAEAERFQKEENHDDAY